MRLLNMGGSIFMRKLVAFVLSLILLVSCLPGLAEESAFVVRNGDREKKQVAITIDDCFNLEMAQRAYDLSMQYNVPITFFVLGIKLQEEDAALWHAIAESHNEIGNHTYGHISLAELTPRQIYTQLTKTQEALDRVLGYHYPMQVFRPPYGHLNRDGKKHVNAAVQAVGYDHGVLWDISQTDFDKCYPQVKNGSILLFHTNKKDLKCIEQLIPRLLEDGYELVTVSEMLGKEPVATSTDLYTYVDYADWQAAQGS